MCLFHFCSKGQTSHCSELGHPGLVLLEREARDEPIKVAHGENSSQSGEPIVCTHFGNPAHGLNTRPI